MRTLIALKRTTFVNGWSAGVLLLAVMLGTIPGMTARGGNDGPAGRGRDAETGDNLLAMQTETGLFPRSGYDHARTGDEIPLALLHLAGVLEGRADELPRRRFDFRLFHVAYHGDLEPHQRKRGDRRTYDHLVFYGPNLGD